MLAGSVDSGEGLLVQQCLQAVPQRDSAKSRHHQLVVVNGEIGLLEVRRHLELAGSYLVVPGGDRHSELVQLELSLGDASLNSLGDAAEAVILELLAAGRWRADERAPAHHEIRPHPE